MALPFVVSLILVGFIFLIFGANTLVNNASALAKKNKISDLIIGLTIVALGTSAPELIVNLIASWQGHGNLVVANILGSNNFNLFIILGLGALIYPLTVQTSTLSFEIPFSFVAALVLLCLGIWNSSSSDLMLFTRIEGLILLLGFLSFLYYIFKTIKQDQASNTISEPQNYHSNQRLILMILVGLLGLVLGGKFVVDYSIILARQLGLSERLIGLTILAIGTSLPELTTSLVAIAKKENDIAVGNVIGSNIFNILLILGFSALIRPVTYNSMFNIDVFILLGGTAFLYIAMFTGKKRKLDRWEAAILLVFYLCYMTYLITKE